MVLFSYQSKTNVTWFPKHRQWALLPISWGIQCDLQKGTVVLHVFSLPAVYRHLQGFGALPVSATLIWRKMGHKATANHTVMGTFLQKHLIPVSGLDPGSCIGCDGVTILPLCLPPKIGPDSSHLQPLGTMLLHTAEHKLLSKDPESNTSWKPAVIYSQSHS